MTTVAHVAISLVDGSGGTRESLGQGRLVEPRIVIAGSDVHARLQGEATYPPDVTGPHDGDAMIRPPVRLEVSCGERKEVHRVARALRANGVVVFELAGESKCHPDNFYVASAGANAPGPVEVLNAAAEHLRSAALPVADEASDSASQIGSASDTVSPLNLLLDGNPDDGDSPIGVFCRLFGMGCPRHGVLG